MQDNATALVCFNYFTAGGLLCKWWTCPSPTGQLFPDNDAKWKGARSDIFLNEAVSFRFVIEPLQQRI